MKLARCPRSLAPTLVTLPSMLLIPSAPLKLNRYPRFFAATLAALPSMSLVPLAPFLICGKIAARRPLTTDDRQLSFFTSICRRGVVLKPQIASALGALMFSQ